MKNKLPHVSSLSGLPLSQSLEKSALNQQDFLLSSDQLPSYLETTDMPLNGRADKIVAIAKNLFANDKSDQAIALLEPLIKAQPDNHAALSEFSQNLRAVGRYGEAIIFGRRAVELQPKQAAYRIETAHTLLAAGDLVNANWILEEGLNQNPTDGRLLIEQARVLLRLGRQDDAIIKAAMAITALPNDNSIRLELAEMLLISGRKDEANAILCDGAQFDPTNPQFLIALVEREMSSGNTTLAEYYAAEAASQAPDNYLINLKLVQLALLKGQFSVAEQQLIRLVESHPSDPVALGELMNLFCQQIERHRKTVNPALLKRFLAYLAIPSRNKLLAAETHLRIVEALGSIKVVAPALTSLEAALAKIDFSSDCLQTFAAKLLRPFAKGKDSIPFSDRQALAILLTRAGNSFYASNDSFKAQACYHLAVAANNESCAARLNLAFMDIARGGIVAALKRLAGVSRVYDSEAAEIIWPTKDGCTWPYRPFNLKEVAEKLKSSSQPWPKVTVITPSFNQAGYIEETLLSVLNQDYPELEYIVVDGASADGTEEILRRYEDRLSALIVEPDEGQTDALNKGLKLATGEIILWVNSDDMLAPGALFMVALTYLEDKADIIAGFCFEHSDRHFQLVNLPAATQATFNVECLGDMFSYWFRGHYFYQPEVAFSRRILEKAGGSLDKDLHYVMDYEFWLRCAAAGGRLSVIRWPVGLFRKHEKQKTTAMDECVVEQAKVRDRFVLPQPSFERKLEIKQRLARAFDRLAPEIAVVSTRASKIFSPDTARELRETFANEGLSVTFYDDLKELSSSEPDLIILLVHLYHERQALQKLRESGYDGPVVGWFWDNHHHIFENFKAAEDIDICIPGHAFAGNYLRSSRYLMGAGVPLCVTQWSGAEAREFFARHGSAQRSDSLYGGFVRYAFAEKRNRLVEELISTGMEGVYFLEEDALEAYFGMSLEERFRIWSSYKVSLCLPLAGDLSQRLFDALLAGQIPLVPRDIYDLDEVIPPALQQQLPIIRFNDYTLAAVKEAYAEALSLFDRDEDAGVLRRNEFALQNHMFAPRIRTIISGMRSFV